MIRHSKFAIAILTTAMFLPLSVGSSVKKADAWAAQAAEIILQYIEDVEDNGTIHWSNGAWTLPNGWTITPNGTTISPSGAVTPPNGAGIQQPNGDVRYPDGRVDYSSGDRWIPMDYDPWPAFTNGDYYDSNSGDWLIFRYGIVINRESAMQVPFDPQTTPTVTLWGGKLVIYVRRFAGSGGVGSGGPIIK